MKLVRATGKGLDAIAALTRRGAAPYERVLPQARRIVESVRRGGDPALLRLRAKFDRISSQIPLRIPQIELQLAWESTAAPVQQALKTAARNIRAFAARQRPKDFDLKPAPGVTTGQRVVPLASVGCYIPSGRYPLPSTLLMTAIPAQVAGVERIVSVSPHPGKETLAAAYLLGISEFYRVGGAHAVAALAYGTPTIPAVDKIVGPGNAWVTAAKRLVAFDCSIDMLAGPTEAVIASETGDPKLIAADLVAQAEHDPETLTVFITTRPDLAKAVTAAVTKAARGNTIATTAVTNRGLAIVARTLDEVYDLTNRIAPEHLTVESAADIAWVRNAGSVFIGRWSAQPLGDYVSGPNHTLPTSGLARTRGGLSVLDFVKLITVQEYSERWSSRACSCGAASRGSRRPQRSRRIDPGAPAGKGHA